MSKKMFLNKVWFWIIVTSVFVAITLGVVQMILGKRSAESSTPSHITIDKNRSKYNFERKWGEDYDKGLIMFTGYISKKDLSFSGATFDLINKPGKTGEQSSDPEFVLEKYNAQKVLVSYQALSAHDKLLTESMSGGGVKELDYWVVSSKIAFEPEVFYWRIVSVDGREIWKTNVHRGILVSAWNGVPDKALTNLDSRQMVESKIEGLKTSYEVLNNNEIIAGLTEIKSLILESVNNEYKRATLIGHDRESMVEVVEEIQQRVQNLEM